MGSGRTGGEGSGDLGAQMGRQGTLFLHRDAALLLVVDHVQLTTGLGAGHFGCVLGGFEEIRLRLPGDSHRVSLLRLKPGRGLPMHRHVGAEYTVVLQGGYTDSTGNYRVGDFAVGPGPEQHEPIADPGEPCIALIVIERPIVLTGPIGRWLNPLVRRDLI